MLLYPEAAAVLDKVAEHLVKVPVVPTDLHARGRGDEGFTVRYAVVEAFGDCSFYDEWEDSHGNPHGALLCQWVADLKLIPRQDEATMYARWEGVIGRAISPDEVSMIDIRRDDLDQWARGRDSAEVAAVFTSAARHARTLPADEGLGEIPEVEEFTEADMPELLDKLAPAAGPLGMIFGTGGGAGMPEELRSLLEMLGRRMRDEDDPA